MAETDRSSSDIDAEPASDKENYRCPHCGVYAQQNIAIGPFSDRKLGHQWQAQTCGACGEGILWRLSSGGWKMVFPLGVIGEAPGPDMPGDVKTIYEEARQVAVLSRRSAAALLRLALQTLINDLEPGSGDINSKIGRLVQRGLHPQIQQAMDVLRVVGNNAVHPGQIDLADDPELVPGLFRLTNIVVDQMISVPKHTQSLFAGLPQRSRDQIDRRDGGHPGS